MKLTNILYYSTFIANNKKNVSTHKSVFIIYPFLREYSFTRIIFNNSLRA